MLNKGSEENNPTPAANAGIIPHLNSNATHYKWIVDSGATNHMTSSLELLHNHKRVPDHEKNNVHLPIGGEAQVTQSGQ